MITRQMAPFFSSTLWALSVGIFPFCISRPSKFNSIGSLLSLNYVLVCKTHFCMSKMAHWSLLTSISFLYVKFANFWYITCFVPNMIPIWSQSHGLVLSQALWCVTHLTILYRSSRPEVFCKKGVLEKATTFTGKHLRQSLFFNKVAGLRPATLLKNKLWHRCFPVNFVKFLRTPFSCSTSGGCFCSLKNSLNKRKKIV